MSFKRVEARILCFGSDCEQALGLTRQRTLGLRGNKLLFRTSGFVNVNLQMAGSKVENNIVKKDKDAKHNKVQSAFVVNNQ